jgi:hypothetical protein
VRRSRLRAVCAGLTAGGSGVHVGASIVPGWGAELNLAELAATEQAELAALPDTAAAGGFLALVRAACGAAVVRRTHVWLWGVAGSERAARGGDGDG